MINSNPTNWLDSMIKECNEYPVDIALKHLDGNDLVCIDAGANVGGFALSKWNGSFSKIYSFEASSYNVEEYLKNVSDDKCKVFHHALSKNDNQKLKLMPYVGDDKKITESGNFSTTKFKYKHNNHGMDETVDYEEVDTISLETILEIIGKEIDLMKIDIEGGEYDFLYEKDLTNIKFITGEFHNFLFHSKLVDNVNQCNFPNDCDCDGGRLYELYDWIGRTHDEIYTIGNAPQTHEGKLFKLRSIL